MANKTKNEKYSLLNNEIITVINGNNWICNAQFIIIM